LEAYSGPITYQCDDNGTLLVPVKVGPMNQTLTTADQVKNILTNNFMLKSVSLKLYE